MKIGIDARTLYHPRTGITRYLSVFLQQWIQKTEDREHSVYLYFPRAIVIPDAIQFPEEIHLRFYGGRSLLPKAMHDYLYFHFWLPFQLRMDGVDLFWGVQHEIPHLIRFFSGSVFVTIHDFVLFSMPETMRFRGWWKKRIKQWEFGRALKYSDKIITDSESTSADLRRYFPKYSEKIKKIYPGFISTPSSSYPPAELGGMPHRQILRYFLSVGSLQPRKNLVRASQSFLRICGEERWKDVYYIIAAPHRWKCDGLPHQEKLLFLENVNDAELAWLYQNAIALVYPSLLEGFGFPILEAYAHGCPVLTSQCSSMPEVGGDLAVYVDPYSIDSIANGMCALLQNDKIRDNVKLKWDAHKRHFDASHFLQQLLTLFLERKNL